MPETSLPIACVTVTTLLFHLMLRRSVNALADSILDGIENGAHSLIRVTTATTARLADALTPRPVAQRTLTARSHA